MATADISQKKFEWLTEDYLTQKRNYWPREGRHILAQYDDDTIVVYQAFNPAIANYAVENQRFGGEKFSFERMSWIKTNFLWMMYRCGWCSKNNQERVLAVRITRQGFAEILANALQIEQQKALKMQNEQLLVRLQWDPDHSPSYGKCQRRAIQLGLKGNILQKYAKDWIVQIDDITKFVKEQKHIYDKKGEEGLLVARERVYTAVSPATASRIGLGFYEAENSVTIIKDCSNPNDQTRITKMQVSDKEITEKSHQDTKATSQDASEGNKINS